MSGVAGVGVDERRARVILAMLAEPDDPVTGGLMRRVGAVETLGLLDTDTTVPGLGRVDGQVWRDRLTSPGRLDGLDQRLRMVEDTGTATLIPGDAQWTRALDDLRERAPYVLFVRGATSFLARPLNDLVTVTGSRAQFIDAIQRDPADRGLDHATTQAVEAVRGLVADGPVGVVADELARLDQEVERAQRAAERWDQTAQRLDAQRAAHRAEDDENTAVLRAAEAEAELVRAEITAPLSVQA